MVVFMHGGDTVEDSTPNVTLTNPSHEQTRGFLQRLLDR
jgi:ABC-type polar amino acid transport system ATPase subunit